MIKDQRLHPGRPIPIRLDGKQLELLQTLHDKTGLSKSFVIRCCINYALQRFVSGEVSILTMQGK